MPQIYNRIGDSNFAIVIDSILGISNSVTTLSVARYSSLSYRTVQRFYWVVYFCSESDNTNQTINTPKFPQPFYEPSNDKILNFLKNVFSKLFQQKKPSYVMYKGFF